MKKFSTKHRVSHSAQDMFDLVADVESYPQFVPLCSGLIVRARDMQDGHEVITADMTVAYKFVNETFTSKVTLDRKDLVITVDYLDGPFKTLHNIWRFLPADARACDIDFFIAYEFRSRALQLLAGAAFDKAMRKLSGAFETRADEVYGTGAEARSS